MTPKLYLACTLILCGHIVAWYATYSQFIWEWCKDNIVYIPLIFALPTSYLFSVRTFIFYYRGNSGILEMK